VHWVSDPGGWVHEHRDASSSLSAFLRLVAEDECDYHLDGGAKALLDGGGEVAIWHFRQLEGLLRKPAD
jgi:hypothetical protein